MPKSAPYPFSWLDTLDNMIPSTFLVNDGEARMHIMGASEADFHPVSSDNSPETLVLEVKIALTFVSSLSPTIQLIAEKKALQPTKLYDTCHLKNSQDTLGLFAPAAGKIKGPLETLALHATQKGFFFLHGSRHPHPLTELAHQNWIKPLKGALWTKHFISDTSDYVLRENKPHTSVQQMREEARGGKSLTLRPYGGIYHKDPRECAQAYYIPYELFPERTRVQITTRNKIVAQNADFTQAGPVTSLHEDMTKGHITLTLTDPEIQESFVYAAQTYEQSADRTFRLFFHKKSKETHT